MNDLNVAAVERVLGVENRMGGRLRATRTFGLRGRTTMGSARSFACAGIAALIMMSAAACSSDSGTNAEGSAVCAYRVTYEGRAYQDVANVEFRVKEKLGAATLPACDDTGAQGGSEDAESTVTAYAVDGISSKAAIAVGETREELKFVAVYSGTKLPAEVKRMIDGS
ncbi:DUF6281 family protein [Streptomyces sp. NPDC055189]